MSAISAGPPLGRSPAATSWSCRIELVAKPRRRERPAGHAYFINPAAVSARVMTAPTSTPRRFGSRGAGLCWRTGLWAFDQSVAARSDDCRDSVAADGVTFGAAVETGLAASLG